MNFMWKSSGQSFAHSMAESFIVNVQIGNVSALVIQSGRNKSMGHIRPYSRNFRWSLNNSYRGSIEPKQLQKEPTLQDVEHYYQRFCGYAKDLGFRTEVFKNWGRPGQKLSFKNLGHQEFTAE